LRSLFFEGGLVLQVTRQQLADLMGVAVNSIARLAAQGMPQAVSSGGGRGRPAQFDAVACLAWQRAQLVADAPGNGSARERYLAALTERVELDLRQRRGELVEMADVRQEFVGLAHTLKSQLRALPAALAPTLVGAAAHGPAAVAALLLQRIDAALRELAQGAERLTQ
jgi:phage terminase Nu1 subunit (DNA packaging protein)